MSDNSKKRKLILQPKTVVTSIAWETEHLIQDAKIILAQELAHYRQKVTKGVNLDLKEARVVTNYLDTLTKLQRAEIEAARAEDLSNLSTEELHQLAVEVLKDSKPAIEPSND